MKRSRLFKGSALVVAMALVVAAMPAMATENADAEPEEETIALIEEEDFDITEYSEVDESTGEEEYDVQYFDDVDENNVIEETEPDEDQSSDAGSEEISDLEVTGVDVDPKEVTLNVIGQTAQLTVTVTTETGEATDEAINYVSSDTTVATVGEDGLVTAVGNGEATITVSCDDELYSDTCAVTVSLFNGFNKDPDSDDWYYYSNGEVVDTTDVIQGTVDGKSGWWNVVNGKVTCAETVAHNSNGWWYINSNGMVDFTYNGFAENSNGWWYCEGGKVTFSKNSVIQDSDKKIDGAAGWWYVVGSQVQTGFTGLADYSNSNGWWYIRNGKVDFTANTVAQNKNGWYYVLGGKVQFGFTGLANYGNENGWWYIRNGKVDFTVNTVAQNNNGWYYVLGGKVQFGFTGLADYSNSSGWWYVKNGKVTFDYTGFAQNKNGWYYVKNSKVDFSKNTVIQGTVNGTNTWWYVVGGKVQTNFTGLANYSNSNGWWYIKNGQVDFTFEGIATNNNGTWLVQNGKVNFNYNGEYPYSGIVYNVTNGRASHPASSIGMDMTMYNKAQSYSSSTKWLILVDVTNCKLGIFQGSSGSWTPVKYWTCTTGKPSTPTIIGSFTIYDKGLSFGDGYTCWYYNRFHNGYMIHSVLYNPGSKTSLQDGRLGQQLSHGCVRLALENAQWVYENVPYNTKVVTYQ